MMYFNPAVYRYVAEARIKRLQKNTWRNLFKKNRNKHKGF